nr:male gametophyte defective 3 [Tanacetum cinerariifolium]
MTNELPSYVMRFHGAKQQHDVLKRTPKDNLKPAKKEWGLSPKAKVRVLHTAQLDVTNSMTGGSFEVSDDSQYGFHVGNLRLMHELAHNCYCISNVWTESTGLRYTATLKGIVSDIERNTSDSRKRKVKTCDDYDVFQTYSNMCSQNPKDTEAVNSVFVHTEVRPRSRTYWSFGFKLA